MCDEIPCDFVPFSIAGDDYTPEYGKAINLGPENPNFNLSNYIYSNNSYYSHDELIYDHI